MISTARVSLAEVFHPWVGSKSLSAGAGGSLGFCPLGLEVLAHNRTTISGTGAEIDGVHINFSRSIFQFMSDNYENCCFDGFGIRELLQIWGFVKPFFAGI